MPWHMSIVVTVIVWIAIGYGLWCKRQAGSVLLSLGRLSRHKMFLVLGVLVILALIPFVWDLLRAGAELKEVSYVLTGLSVGVYWLFSGLSGLEIREAGIFCDGRLLKWERIESYEWEEKALTVRVKRRWPRTVSYPVPPLHRHAVNDLFAQHASGATS